MADSDNHGNWLLSAMMIIWAWSALMFVVRVWAKLNVKRWGAEDYAVTVAFVSIAISSLLYLGALTDETRYRLCPSWTLVLHSGQSSGDMAYHFVK